MDLWELGVVLKEEKRWIVSKLQEWQEIPTAVNGDPGSEWWSGWVGNLVNFSIEI